MGNKGAPMGNKNAVGHHSGTGSSFIQRLKGKSPFAAENKSLPRRLGFGLYHPDEKGLPPQLKSAFGQVKLMEKQKAAKLKAKK